MDIFVDQEFRGIIPPLSEEEYQALDASIAKDGNLVPVVVWKETQLLIDGHNRYDLCLKREKPLKPPIEVSLPDRTAALLWIIGNQLARRNLPPAARIALELKRHDLEEKQAAKKNQEATYPVPGQKGFQPSVTHTSESHTKPTTQQQKKKQANENNVDAHIAKKAGVSRNTVNKFRKIVDKMTPEQKEKLMKGEATVNQIAVAIRREEVRQEVAAKTDWPSGKYRVLYGDPPWQYDNDISADKLNDVELHYKSMKLQDICDLPVKDMAMDDAVLFLWVTTPMLPEGLKVLSAWGFEYKTCFVWDKVAKTFGHYSGLRHELLLVGVRGACQPDKKTELPESVQAIAKDDHSHKPPLFRAMIDDLYPHGPRVELFAREHAQGWVAWGDQVNG